jgi:hypothetical protein
MANLTEVQMALKQGDKAKANQLLKTILQKNPSADAWVMAARMSSNPENTKLHLQRALAFDSKHVKARDMLRDLGVKPLSTSAALTDGFLSSVRIELEKFGANKPVLRDLSPTVRMVTAICMYIVVIALMLLTVNSLLTPPVESALPPLTVFPTYQGETLINQWTTEGLNLSKIENVVQKPEELSKETLKFTVTDDSGSHQITVFLYGDIAGVVDDGHHLTPLTADGKNKMDILQTAAIIYPTDLNEVPHALLVSAFNPTPAASM